MKYEILTIFLIHCSGLFGQTYEHKDTVSLSEVVVSSAGRIRHGVDGDVYIPSSLQKKHSANGLELLAAVKYPGIKIDLLEKSIGYISSGNVQLRINNVISTMDDLQSLSVSQVKNIRFITAPGLKYGNNVGVVIDVVCRNDAAGTSAAISTMNAVTSNYNDVSGWVKQATKNVELGLIYNFRSNSNKDVFTKTENHYKVENLLPSHVERHGHYSRSTFTVHNLTLSCNYMSPNSRHVFDMKFSGNFSGFPQRELEENVETDGVPSTSATKFKSSQVLPSVKFYYSWNIDKASSLTAYWTGAYLKNKYDRGFIAQSMDETYHVDGSKYSLHGELNYSRKFSAASALDVGAHYDASSTSNIYTGNLSSSYSMHDDKQFFFAEHKFSKGKLQLETGLGGERIHFSNNNDSYTFWSLKPYAVLEYVFNETFSGSYRYERYACAPALADLTDYKRRDDLYEATIGNACLKPYNVNSHELKLNADYGNTFLRLLANYDLTMDGIYTKSPVFDATFNGYLFTKANGATKHHLQISFYAEQYLLRKKLFLYAMPYMVRDIVRSDDYVHTNTCFALKAGMSLYLGDFSIDFDYDSPSENLESEFLTRNAATTNLCVSYKKKTFSAKIGIRNAFNPDGAGTAENRLSSDALRVAETRNHAFGNMVYLGIAWNMKSAKRHKSPDVISTNANLDGGIIR